MTDKIVVTEEIRQMGCDHPEYKDGRVCVKCGALSPEYLEECRTYDRNVEEIIALVTKAIEDVRYKENWTRTQIKDALECVVCDYE